MERWWWNRERQRPLKPRNRSIPWLLFKRCTCGAEIESSLHTFRYGNILNPYSKAVPAVIAKASAIYNPFIYAITHGNYRWGPQTNYATLKKYTYIDQGSYFYRDALATKVPCLHFLKQPSRGNRMSVSHSDSSFRDSVLSRQSSVSKTKFYRISSMSTTDTVSLFSKNISKICGRRSGI